MSGLKRHKTVTKPGFHLKPKYDLHYLRRQRNHSGKPHVSYDLPLVSMIDMFSILVIYLIMNFSATGEIFFIQKDLILPEATHAHPMVSAPLITVTSQNVTLETEHDEGKLPVIEASASNEYLRIVAALRELRTIDEQTKPGEKFKGNINIQADEDTPLIFIKKVMQTCILEGWAGINFAVRDTSEN